MQIEDYTMPVQRYIPVSTPDDYTSFQNEFTNLIREKYTNSLPNSKNSKGNPYMVAPNLILNSALGGQTEIREINDPRVQVAENSKLNLENMLPEAFNETQIKDDSGVVTVGPGGFGVQGDNYGIKLNPRELGVTYTSDNKKLQIGGSVNPLGNDDFRTQIKLSYNPADEVTNRIQIDGSKVGLIDKKPEIQETEVQAYLNKYLPKVYGSVNGMGTF